MVTVESHEGIHVVQMDDGKVNVLDLGTLHGLISALQGLREAAAVVLTGTGRAFSAGVDLRRMLEGGRPYLSEFLPALTDVFRAVFDFPRPLVAAVNGHAIAGGCILAAGCDVRLMSAGRIGVTEVLVGLPFPPSALETLRFAVGSGAARLALTGETLSPEQARTIGLVDEVVGPSALLETAIGRARSMARIPAETFTQTKTQLRQETSARIEVQERAYADRVLDAWSSDWAYDAIGRYLDQLARR